MHLHLIKAASGIRLEMLSSCLSFQLENEQLTIIDNFGGSFMRSGKTLNFCNFSLIWAKDMFKTIDSLGPGGWNRSIFIVVCSSNAKTLGSAKDRRAPNESINIAEPCPNKIKYALILNIDFKCSPQQIKIAVEAAF